MSPRGRRAPVARAPQAQERLWGALQDELHHARRAVLVLGDGLKRQQTGRGNTSEWQWVLSALHEQAGGEAGEIAGAGSPALQWLLVVRQWSLHHGCAAERAESLLKAALVDRLRELEQGLPKPRSLYARIVGAQFAHIISFNIDRRIIAHLPPAAITAHEPTSFLDGRVTVQPGHGLRGTTIWFPYGSTARADSIELGYGSYSGRLVGLEDYRHGMMERSQGWSGDYSTWELEPPNDVYWREMDRIESWFDLFFIAPLVFIGTSLSPDDWPLWWLLHQRARNFAAFPEDDCPPTFYLTTAGPNATLHAGRPAGIDLVLFETHDAIWRFLRDALRQPLRV